MSIKITIITSTFNADKYLEESINSIIPQLRKDDEYIIIDALSSDSTIDIINKYSASITYWISEKDVGIYDAWNKGLKVATGDWIMFIGSDDFLKSNALKHYREFIEEYVSTDCLYISSKNEIIDSEKNIIRIYGWPWVWKTFKRRNNISHPGSLHSINLFKNYGMYNEKYKIAGDYELLLRPKEKLNARFLNEITIQVTQGGVSSNPRMFKEHYFIVINTANTSKLIATYDFYIQYMKMFLKNFFMNFGIQLKYRKEY
jgi:glycosyltransferase involved in cell wall biosynthesis